jgi:hypothetical protein
VSIGRDHPDKTRPHEIGRTSEGKERFMKRKSIALLVGVFSMGFFAVAGSKTVQVPGNAGPVTLEVLNPRGEIPPPPFFAPSARVADLAGKKIGIYWIGKAGGNNFWDVVQEMLKQRYPTAQVLRYRGPFDLGERRATEIAKEVDTFLYGVGD